MGLARETGLDFEFQYPLMDRLYFGGIYALRPVLKTRGVSVSSDGSFVFWGHDGEHLKQKTCEFQYPLMDRLYFGGTW